MNEESIFAAALEIATPADRAAYLDRACGDDADLRRRVEALLRAHFQPGDFLEPPAASEATAAPDIGPTVARPIAEGPGSTVGPYKLLQKIGEGGMGAVYMAEQEHPVRRRVALKIIKPGMDSAQVVARFEAERQALAMMDHQNIARVLDAGTTDAGRPYFVMELVKGVPITAYCDQNHLTPRERLELFVPVCQAIQHAHQKGVIHRDVKPSNVLVTLYNGQPVPKVIDFGVAKAIDQRLTERTMFTQFGAIIGTLEYMSPEQAELSGLDIDTRSDIYSLGVLLYELLTGSTPLEKAKLRQAAYSEILRRIREEEPTKPSTRLSESKDALPTISAQRKTEPAKLARLVRGELDWIVMKALEKDRTRRYETANSFARDVQRYLEGDPVEAGPPSASYRMSKLIRKHRASLATVAAFAMMLLAAAVGGTYLAYRARSAERLAKRQVFETTRAKAATEEALAQAEAVSRYLVEVFRSPDPVLDGHAIKVVELLDRAALRLDAEFKGNPRTKGQLLNALGETYHGLGLYDKSASIFEKARSLRALALGPDHPDTIGSMIELVGAYCGAGRTDPDLVMLAEQALVLARKKLGLDDRETLRAMRYLADAYLAADRIDQAITVLEQTLALMRKVLGPNHPETLGCMDRLAYAYQRDGREDQALSLNEKTLALRKALLGNENLDTLVSMERLACSYASVGRFREAISLFEEELKLSDQRLGPDHPTRAITLSNFSGAYQRAGQTEQAITLGEQALELAREKLGPQHVETLHIMKGLASTYMAAGRSEKAVVLYEQLLELANKKLGGDHTLTVSVMGDLAEVYRYAGRSDEAIALGEEAMRRHKTKLGPDHPWTVNAMQTLAAGYWPTGRVQEAVALFEDVLRRRRAKPGPDHPQTLITMGSLIEVYRSIGRLAESIALGEEALSLSKAKLGSDHPTTLFIASNLALAYESTGRRSEAIELNEQTLKLRTAGLGPDHPDTLASRNGLAGAYTADGRLDAAEPLLRENLATLRRKGPADSPAVAGALAALGFNLLLQHKAKAAEPPLREALAIRERALPDDWSTFNARSLLGGSLSNQKKYGEAEPLLLTGYEGMKARETKIPAPGRRRLTEAGERIARLYEAWGKPEKAAEWRARLGKEAHMPELPADPFARPGHVSATPGGTDR